MENKKKKRWTCLEIKKAQDERKFLSDEEFVFVLDNQKKHYLGDTVEELQSNIKEQFQNFKNQPKRWKINEILESSISKELKEFASNSQMIDFYGNDEKELAKFIEKKKTEKEKRQARSKEKKEASRIEKQRNRAEYKLKSEIFEKIEEYKELTSKSNVEVIKEIKEEMNHKTQLIIDKAKKQIKDAEIQLFKIE